MSKTVTCNIFDKKISIPVYLRSQSEGAYSFEILVEGSDTSSLSSITVKMKYLFTFQF